MNRMTIVTTCFMLCLGCRPEPGTSYYDDQETFRFDAGARDAPVPVPVLPLAVDEWFSPSGYMGDGEDGLIEDTACAVRKPDALGRCHRFVWTRGAKGWAGVFWQFPDGNWGTADGLAMPNDATVVRFDAWGDAGGEVVTFGVGMGDVDGFGKELMNIELTTEVTEYTIELSDIEYTRIVGGFVWTSSESR
jgi:hypothetical protein